MKKVIALMLMVMFVLPVVSFAETTTTTTTSASQTLTAKEQKKADKELRKAEKKAQKEAKKAEKKAMKEAKKAEKKAQKEAKKLGKESNRGEAVTLSAEKLACMKTAVAKREASLIAAFTEFSDDSVTALKARSTALADAYTKADGAERRVAREVAREAFRMTMKDARKEEGASRKVAWNTFRTDAQACGVAHEEDGHESESEVEIEDESEND